MHDVHQYAVFLAIAVAIIVLNMVTRRRGGGQPGAKVGIRDMQTIVKHARQLDQAAIDRMKEMNAQGAATEDLCRALFADYDACGEGEKRALGMLVDKMRNGDVKMKTSFATAETRHETVQLDKDALARARHLHADGADTDGICREVVKDYSSWDSERQEKMQQTLNKLLEKS